MSKKEYCIMPKDYLYETTRFYGSERHEIFFGKNRNNSIEDGLVVFITSQQHRGTYGVHGKKGHQFDTYLKKKGQLAYMKHYGKSVDDFIKRYGKNYLDEENFDDNI